MKVTLTIELDERNHADGNPVGVAVARVLRHYATVVDGLHKRDISKLAYNKLRDRTGVVGHFCASP